MLLSTATDYCTGVHEVRTQADFMNGAGNPEYCLRRIAEAGFSHVHWCHHWRSDFFYQEPEIRHIERLLKGFGLQLLDTHGSEGIEKFWYAPQEYARLAGVELVKNRIEFTARLGGDAVVMHAYPMPADQDAAQLLWSQLRRTLDALTPFAQEYGVIIAIENLVDFWGIHFEGKEVTEVGDNWDLLAELFSIYPADAVGLCYDSGHAQLGSDRSGRLIEFVDRLAVLHMHDNDGTGDLHRLVFDGVADWGRLAEMIAVSAYKKPVTLEICHDPERYGNLEAFLAEGKKTGDRFSQMIEQARSRLTVRD